MLLVVAVPQCSVRVDKGGGVPGRTMADWLVGSGLEAPREESPNRASAGGRDLARAPCQRQAMRAASRREGAATGTTHHRSYEQLSMPPEYVNLKTRP